MNATLTKNPEHSTKSVLLVRYPEKYRPLGLGHSRTQRSTNDSDPAARSHSRQILLLIWNQLENTGATRSSTLDQAEYVLALDIGFILTKWNLVYLYGKDGTIEYSPNVLEFPRVRLGKFYATPLRVLAPMGEMSMEAGIRNDGFVVFACLGEPENLP